MQIWLAKGLVYNKNSNYTVTLSVCFITLIKRSLTAVRIDSDLLARSQRFFDVPFLDTLNAQIAEADAHSIVVDLHRAHALLAALLAD